MAQTHSILSGSYRAPPSGAKAIKRTDAKSVIEITLKLRRKKPLTGMTRRPKTAMSRKYHEANHGASSADIAKVTKAFKKFSLRMVRTHAASRTVRLSGSVAQMEVAFRVTLFDYDHPDGAFRGHVGPIHVPVSVKSMVQGVFGLDNRRIANIRRTPALVSQVQSAAAIPASWYTPQELAQRYKFPAGDGSGQAIGLLELGGGYFPADMQRFCTLVHIPAPRVTPVGVNGAATNAQDGTEGEAMMDAEIAAAVCPKANIVMYFATGGSDGGFMEVIDYAIHDQQNNPGVLSMSWGGPEEAFPQQSLNQINESLKDAAALGVTVCFASGDDGSSDQRQPPRDGHVHVNFPASSPYALAVGGTMVPAKGSNQPDVVWHEGTGFNDGSMNDGSTGGGVSAAFPRPAWQNAIAIKSANPGAILGRCLPDIAANADWTKSPYVMCADGKTIPNGGTSAATPLMAALLTLINAQRSADKRVGYVTPVLYQQAQGGRTVGAAGCTDVVSGNNNTAAVGGYSAGLGYDACSGWGTPIGTQLAQLL